MTISAEHAEHIRTVVGIIGNVLSGFLFLSPAPTMIKIFRNKSVEEFQPYPYIMTVMNCLLWIFYGLPFNHPDSTLVITINSAGLVLQLIYLLNFFIYGDGHWKKICGIAAIEVLILGLVIGLDLGLCHTHKSRSTLVGIFCVVAGVIMYVSPLGIMRTVIKTKSVEFMPFYLSLASFLNGCCWTAYALLKFDPFILTANGLGALSGLAQLILYAVYYPTTPKTSKEGQKNCKKGQSDVKPSELQLHNVV